MVTDKRALGNPDRSIITLTLFPAFTMVTAALPVPSPGKRHKHKHGGVATRWTCLLFSSSAPQKVTEGTTDQLGEKDREETFYFFNRSCEGMTVLQIRWKLKSYK